MSYPVPEYYYPCVPPEERDAIEGIVTQFVGGTLVLTDLQYQAAIIASGLDAYPERQAAFGTAWPHTRIETGLPFPLDVIWEFNADPWDGLYDYVYDVVIPDLMPECSTHAFPGNQGGAWPVLWPSS
jgi:hypothetical protein